MSRKFLALEPGETLGEKLALGRDEGGRVTHLETGCRTTCCRTSAAPGGKDIPLEIEEKPSSLA
jgi:hypothetical protein